MPPDQQSQLLKGVLSLLLLALVDERESYGYELVQRLQQVGFTDMGEGTVYPALARLEREGRLSTRLVPSRSGPARKYYRISPDGRRALRAGAAAWLALSDIATPLLSRQVPATTEGKPT